MRRHYPTPSPVPLQRTLCDELNALLPWIAIGRSLPVEALLRVLALMACWRASLHAVLNRLAFGCCENTVRQGLLRQLPDLADLSTRLSERLTRWVGHQPRQGFHIAIDTHYSPYYGDGSTAGVIRGQLKASTRKFFLYATACIVEWGRRWTVAVAAIESGRPDAALEPLLRHLVASGVTIRSLVLDKWFFATDVFARLHRERIPYVVAVPHNRPALKRFLRGRTEAVADYHLHSRRPGGNAVTIRLRRVRYHRGGRRRTEVYAVDRRNRMSDDALRAHYRRRFAIESSYRQMRQVKAPTTSTNRVWRLLLVGLALILRQLWVARDREATRDRSVPLTLMRLAWIMAQGLAASLNRTLDPGSYSSKNRK